MAIAPAPARAEPPGGGLEEAQPLMPYLRVDDNMSENPKMIALSDRAFRMYVRGLCYAQRHLTDGFLPRQQVFSWGTLKRIGELMARGLWVECAGGYQIHDYLDWNDSRETIQEKRRRDSARKTGGIRSESARNPSRNPPGFPGVGVGVGKEEEDALFVRFWSAYPKRVMEGASRSLFRTLVADGEDAEAIIAGAEAYARSVAGQPIRFISAPLRWLEERRWTDELEPPRPPSPEDIEAEVQAFVAEGGAT